MMVVLIVAGSVKIEGGTVLVVVVVVVVVVGFVVEGLSVGSRMAAG